MQKVKFTYGSGRPFGVLLMMAALLWLNISTPYVYAAWQADIESKSLHCQDSDRNNEGSSLNPFANTTEEKPESGGNTLSEYLHDMHLHTHYVAAPGEYSKCHPADLYYAFHPELISPPPDA